MKKNYHVVPHQDRWAVLGAGNQKPSNVTKTQIEAINIAKEKAKSQESELIIHNKRGQIREKNTYGPDKCPPRG